MPHGLHLPTSLLKTHSHEELLWRFMIRAGLDVSAYDCQEIKNSQSSSFLKPGLTLLFPLSGDRTRVSLALEKVPLQCAISPKNVYLIFSCAPLHMTYDINTHDPFRALKIRVSRPFLKHLNLESLIEERTFPRALMIESASHMWIGSLLATRLITDMALKLFAHNSAQERDLLSIATGSFNLLSAVVAALREPLFCQQVKLLRDVKKLESIRNMLLEHLDKPWTIKELARHVGLNEKRLKEGFRQQFGLPIYTFLQRSRLHAAREILMTKDVKIIDVAIAVGYANPSRFSELFCREFGVTPSVFKSNPQFLRTSYAS